MIHPRTLEAVEYGKMISYFAGLCMSETGRETAALLKPLQDVEVCRAQYGLYREAAVWLSWPGANRFAASAFPDVRDILTVAQKNYHLDESSQKRMRLDLDAFWAMREMLRLAQKAHESLNDPAGARNWPALLQMVQESPMPVQLLAALNRCVSDDGLLDESSPELFRLRNEMRSLHQNCLRKVKDFANQYNMLPYLQDEFMTLSSDRYVLPLKANFKGRMQGIIHDWSQTGETCYFEPIFLVEVNNRLQELKHEEREEEQKILEYLSDLLNQELPGAKAAMTLLTTIDILNAKILFAQKLNAECPEFTTDDAGIELLNARHPILALNENRNHGSSVRPLDIILRPGDRALVITGGNAGGKTVCLKTLGLVSALAMSGLPVPVGKGSHLPWFGRMDAFIGDEQSLDANVSTFTAQIDHLAKAWKHLDNRGLVLLDEFGAGTDPAEGAALAQAVLDGLLEKKCFVLSATHFPALKSYALTRDGVRAASMLFNPATNKPLFKLAYDQVGSSQALAVAQEHGLPESILARARHYLLQDGQDSSALLTRLNALAAEREVEIEHLHAQELAARNQLKEKNEKLDKERKRLREEMSGHIATLMRAWKEGKQNAKQTLKEMSGLREELGLTDKSNDDSVLRPAQNIVPGQTVFHSGLNKRAIVREVDLRKNRARLDLNGVGMWADIKDIRETGSDLLQNRSASKNTSVSKGPEAASMVVDVRGMRSDEALATVERFLDRALLAGFSEVEIVHGRGTGALRREIHEFLRAFPAAANYQTAPEDRGGDGMTIVELV